MSSLAQHQKVFRPIPPDKGSFPLDHEGTCRTFMIDYQMCLLTADGNASLCRESAKNYLQCRMENHLMAKEEWSKLGFQNQETKSELNSPTTEDQSKSV